eukprot:SAG11_NODE_2646_length_3132_cov_4.768216_1_plen_272_part_00
MAFLGMSCCAADDSSDGPSRRSIRLGTRAATMLVDLAGGSIAAFSLPERGAVNPLSWDAAKHDRYDPSDRAPRPLGHFLCLDRWGPPTLAERQQGMPYHGEASNVEWEVLESGGESEGSPQSLVIKASLPMAGFEVERRVTLASTAPIAMTTETVRNVRPLGRAYNMVQHPSLAHPFLTEQTLVQCNAVRGFAQGANTDELTCKEVRMCAGVDHTLHNTSLVYPKCILATMDLGEARAVEREVAGKVEAERAAAVVAVAWARTGRRRSVRL